MYFYFFRLSFYFCFFFICDFLSRFFCTMPIFLLTHISLSLSAHNVLLLIYRWAQMRAYVCVLYRTIYLRWTPCVRVLFWFCYSIVGSFWWTSFFRRFRVGLMEQTWLSSVQRYYMNRVCVFFFVYFFCVFCTMHSLTVMSLFIITAYCWSFAIFCLSSYLYTYCICTLWFVVALLSFLLVPCYYFISDYLLSLRQN